MRTGMVLKMRLPKQLQKMTTSSAVSPTTKAGHDASCPSQRNTSFMAVSARSHPMTKMISAITTAGMKRVIQSVPTTRTTRAHRIKIRPAPTMAEPTPDAPAVALAITTGPMKLNEGPR